MSATTPPSAPDTPVGLHHLVASGVDPSGRPYAVSQLILVTPVGTPEGPVELPPPGTTTGGGTPGGTGSAAGVVPVVLPSAGDGDEPEVEGTVETPHPLPTATTLPEEQALPPSAPENDDGFLPWLVAIGLVAAAVLLISSPVGAGPSPTQLSEPPFGRAGPAQPEQASATGHHDDRETP